MSALHTLDRFTVDGRRAWSAHQIGAALGREPSTFVASIRAFDLYVDGTDYAVLPGGTVVLVEPGVHVAASRYPNPAATALRHALAAPVSDAPARAEAIRSAARARHAAGEIDAHELAAWEVHAAALILSQDGDPLRGPIPNGWSTPTQIGHRLGDSAHGNVPVRAAPLWWVDAVEVLTVTSCAAYRPHAINKEGGMTSAMLAWSIVSGRAVAAPDDGSGGAEQGACSEFLGVSDAPGARWDGTGGGVLISSDGRDLYWSAEVTVRVGHAKSTYAVDLGMVSANSTESRAIVVPGGVVPHEAARDHLSVVVVRLAASEANDLGDVIAANARLDERLVAFHEGLEGNGTLYADGEWQPVLPWGLVNPSAETVAALSSVPRDVLVVPHVPSGRTVQRPEFEGNDVPDHRVVPEDDDLVVALGPTEHARPMPRETDEQPSDDGGAR